MSCPEAADHAVAGAPGLPGMLLIPPQTESWVYEDAPLFASRADRAVGPSIRQERDLSRAAA
jgi:hypothetical protein